MGPDGGQLGVDSGFVLRAVRLEKTQYFQNSLVGERSLAEWAEPGNYSQPREEVKGPSRLLEGGSACHMLSLACHLYVPSLHSLVLQCLLEEEPHASQEGAVLPHC